MLTNLSEWPTVAGNVALLPPDVIFALLSSQRLLAESIFIVRCHVTSKQLMRMYAVREKCQAI